jgi:hypothetical protein
VRRIAPACALKLEVFWVDAHERITTSGIWHGAHCVRAANWARKWIDRV